jgi:hypothetical protein
LKILGVIFLVVLAVVFVAVLSSPPKESSVGTQSAAAASVDCGKAKAEMERGLIYKVDGKNGYFVYVTRVWRGLMIDEKQAVAYLAATCYSQGSVRILDASTGKLLARWGTNGYVNYE